jgi:tetratricopeptide (TPR) repeat protein
MLRAFPLVVGLLLQSLRPLSAQSAGTEPQPPAPSLPAPSSQAEPALVNVQSLLDAGQANEAEKAARSYLETHPSSADAHYLLGYILFREANPKASLVEYTEGERYRTPSALDLEVIGCDYLLLEDYAAAGKWFAKAVELDPTDAAAQFYLGRARFNEEARSLIEIGKLRAAEQLTRQYLEAHQDSADGHYLLGYILFKEEDPKSSLAEYTEGAKYRTPSAADLEAVAGDYVLLKDYPDADKWFTKAVEWNPKDALGWYYLGRTKYNENRFEEAVSAFQKCLALDPRNVKAEDNLGLSYEGLNRIDEAVAAYRTAIAWQANSTDKNHGPFFDLGSLLVENDRAQEALTYLVEAAKISAKDYRVYRQLGKAHARLNQLDKARAEFEHAVELAPGNAPIHFMLAQVYRRQGLLDKAKAETEMYAKLSESSTSTQK